MITVIETESVGNETDEDIWNLVEAFYHNEKHLMIHSEVCHYYLFAISGNKL